MEEKNEPHQYQWILNEGLLRDEGTLYGIAGAETQDKIEAIRDYYRIKKASSRTKKAHLDKKIEDINHHLSASSNPVPIMLQLLFYAGICYFNYWLESYWLSPVIHAISICIGLYLFGLFSVFIGRSIMYNAIQSLSDEKTSDDQREKWKIYFEEWGVSLIVSLFISVLPAKAYPIQYSIVATCFFFMLFLFGGKGLINTFFRARKELSQYFLYRQLHALHTDQQSTNAALEELDGEEEYKIKIFTSEYKLASESRQLTNDVVMKKLA